MKLTSLLRIAFAVTLFAGLSLSIPTVRADDGDGCSSCCGKKKDATPSSTPTGGGTSTNAPVKS
jgi:hypothetical protein